MRWRSKDGDSNFTKTDTANAEQTQHPIKRMEPGNTYVIRLLAVTNQGQSLPSEAVKVIVDADSGPIEAAVGKGEAKERSRKEKKAERERMATAEQPVPKPAGVVPMVSGITSTSAIVSWKGGDQAVGYVLDKREGNSPWKFLANVQAPTRSYTFGPLEPGTKYEVRIRAAYLFSSSEGAVIHV